MARRKLNALNDALNATPVVQATVTAARTAYENAKTAYETAKQDLDDAATKAEKKLAEALKAKPQVPADITAAEGELKTAEDNMKGSNGGALDQKAYEGSPDNKTGLYALDKADLFNLLCIPPDTRDGDTPVERFSNGDGVLHGTPRHAHRRFARCLEQEQGHGRR